MKRLFVAGLLFVFMAVMPVFADNNQTCDGQIENYVSATGTVAQNGTPSPTNPIEPVFYKQGDMILRKVGDYADSYDATTGKITRRIGMKVLDGTETFWAIPASDQRSIPKSAIGYPAGGANALICSHYPVGYSTIQNTYYVGSAYINFIVGETYTTMDAWKNYLAQQYAAGTPVTVYYPLETETTEDIGTTYCALNIKIATTAYNAARFSPVQPDLNNAVATIREIVTKTINQTAAIASLQADKQTRPADACPAGKKCLLVETEENGVVVPHWFPIVENICGVPSGYTCLDYIQASGTQYIDTGIVPTLTSGAHVRAKFLALKSTDNIIFGATDSTAFAGGSPFSIDVFTNRVLMPFGGGANNSVNYSPTISKTMETNVLYDFKLNYLNDKKASVNDTQVTYSNPVTMTSRSLLLFNLNSSAGGMSQYAATKSQIFSAVITDGSNIVFNGVPAKRDSDGVIGVYDTVSDRFLTNAGTGTFTAGPEI